VTSRRLPPVPRLESRARVVRRHRMLRHVVLTTGAVAPLVLLAWLLLSSPLLRLQRVEVTGASRVSNEEVLAAAEATLGTPLARVDTAAVRARVSQLGPVGEVEVTRGWPRTLHVVVHERAAVAGVQQGADDWRLVDATGTWFASADALPRGLVRLQSADAVQARTTAASTAATAPAVGDATRAALDVLTALPEPLRERVRTVRAPTAASVTLLLRGGRTVVWGTSMQPVRKAAVVEALLRRKGDTIDVTSPNVAVVR